ncbi:RidA family protein [Paenibacillus beijingensis]|uniref:Endoribonuclease L-PSP/chorismate mutase-like domain-containing protein n=1 Tax=Paenibacillus beijingensis TaxID=1126833 RepID=A0A0D5NRG8_9BACL|nr:RidA family protein [Paenibacillus beijingensis]AJY77881.1 hypothetical protein VN24_20280 [Paenibacillus beijingensis]
MPPSAEQKLETLRIPLPEPNTPSGNYVPYTMLEPLLYLSGVTPKTGGKLLYKGKVGQDLTKEEGYEAARLCMVNQLSAIRSALGTLDRVAGILKLEGFIQADADFEDLPFVLNGASDLLVEVFGDRGKHARSAIGVSSLPSGAAVEVELTVFFK